MLKQKMMKVALCGAIITSIGTGVGIADNKAHAMVSEVTEFTLALGKSAVKHQNIIDQIGIDLEKMNYDIRSAPQELNAYLTNINRELTNRNEAKWNIIVVRADMKHHFYASGTYPHGKEVLVDTTKAIKTKDINGRNYLVYIFDTPIDFYIEQDSNKKIYENAKTKAVGAPFRKESIVVHTGAKQIGKNGEWAYHFDQKKGDANTNTVPFQK